MFEEQPRFASLALGVLAGFGAGLLLSALLLAGRFDRSMEPAGAVLVQSTPAPTSSAPPPPTVTVTAPPPAPVTVVETQVVTRTEFAPQDPRHPPTLLPPEAALPTTGSSLSSRRGP
ncbi:hypothetical protein [Amycolatopsis nigrescens]|uniref:hypothetical protein n=1 Tax=Amycolatopsis nigrescens TaxID=381445 RepID=UPI000364DE87|nr:hypothetical protein [Amycolatopsis nigrescens]